MGGTDAMKVRALLAAGANVRIKTSHGGTHYMRRRCGMATRMWFGSFWPTTIQRGCRRLDSHRGGSMGDRKVVQLLLAGGAIITPEAGLVSPTTAAIQYGHVDVVRLLLTKGCHLTRAT